MAGLTLAALLVSAPSFAQSHGNTKDVDLKDYQGSYEGREFRLDGDTMTYFREGMSQSINLMLIGTDHFSIDIPPGAVVQSADGHEIPSFRFQRDEQGKVTTLEIVMPDGTVSARHPRTGDLASVQDKQKIE